MISIVICSRKKLISKKLEQNIGETIGCDFEMIVIDNSENQYSIFQAYNEGLRKSQFSIACFIHEDILFHTYNWSDVIFKTFNDSGIKLLGVAGSRIKSEVPSGWWEQPKESLVINIIQHRSDGNIEHLNKGFKAEQNLEKVSVLDGVFLVLKKDIEVRFNEKLSGFHNYDLSICIDLLKAGHQIGVTRKILIEHFSNGRIDNSWVNSSHEFHEEYKKSLPVSINNQDLIPKQKIIQLQQFIVHCKNAGNVRLALHYWFKLLKINPFSSKNIRYVAYFLKFTGNKISNKWN